MVFSDDEVGKILKNTVSHLFIIHASLVNTKHKLQDSGVHNTALNLYMSSAHLLDHLSSEAFLQAKFLINQLDAILDKVIN